MGFIKYIILSCFILIGLYVFGQKNNKDSTVLLKEVNISSNRLHNFGAGIKVQIIDSNTINQYKSGNLSNVLENESPLFIKTYGSGSLATSSFRGGSANHTAIIWNGFNISNPMNGQVDLSLIPVNFINNISIQYGGTSALWGSGAVAGTIQLNNDLKFNDGINITAGSSYGSYSNFGKNLQLEISKQKWAGSFKFFNQIAKNNFEYYNTQLKNSPKQKQLNAELKQYELLVENLFYINKNQQINIRFWLQQSNRNIPPIMLQTSSSANQKDDSYRVTSEWQKINNRIICFLRVAYFDEMLTYSDNNFSIPTNNRSQIFFAESESKIKVYPNQLLNVGVNHAFTQAISENYSYKPKQNKTTAFISYRINSKYSKVVTTMSGRQEIIEKKLSPFTWSIGSEYAPTKWISAKCNLSKIFRVPTFNDLYWVPGGNKDLLPEKGFSEEVGIAINLVSKNKKHQFLFEPTLFNRNMKNWILWLPGQTYWSPQNIMEVWSRGAETRTELGFKIKQVIIKLDLLTSYVLSTNQKSKSENDASVGKQLIYVPMYSGHGKFSLVYKNFLFSINQNYTGYRYTSNDNTEYLEPYFLTNIYLSYKLRLNQSAFYFFVQINNLFNQQYQLVLNRAMPLKNYLAGITIQFNNPNNNKIKLK